MKTVTTALTLTVMGAALVLLSALLRIFHVVDRPVGYVLLGIGVVLGLVGNVLRRRAAKQDRPD
ncbi:hypothetical protein [Rufibacter psychrotolerans]|uniref:hypothetical protein n=1 Tax=Rufibacter psychrotolerans TaxID=2812556 RepID=UPI001968185D|nr:hypothetical protein [Rufibacter sp. SYSU D00308]